MNVSSAARQAVFVSVVALSICPALGCRKQTAPKVPEDAVAMVGDRPITQAQVQKHIDRLPPVLRQQYASAEKRRLLLDALIRNEVLLQEARRRGLDKDPDYQQTMEQQLIAKLLAHEVDGQKAGASAASGVSDAEVAAHYEANRAAFTAPEQVRISQIVVPDRALADRLLKQVRQLRKNDAAGFAALAAKHSTDAPSRERGGDAGFLTADTRMHSPTVRAAAFAAQGAGRVADLVETPHGFHILRLTERLAAAPRPLDQVKEQIRQHLAFGRRTKKTEDLVREAQGRTKIQVFEKRLGAAPAANGSLTLSR